MSKTPAQTAEEIDNINNPKVAASTLDFLLIELVPLVQRTTERLEAEKKAIEEEYRRSKILSSAGADDPLSAPTDDQQNVATKSEDTPRPVTSLGFPVVEGSTQNIMHVQLDSLGYRVGQGLVERFSVNTPRPQSPLDSIKFLCKDLWPILFRKQIDNLKTNHRGIFVLTDSRFQPLSRMSIDRRSGPKARDEGLARAQLSLYWPAGVVRGALSALGIEATVTAEVLELPSAVFTIKSKGAKP